MVYKNIFLSIAFLSLTLLGCNKSSEKKVGVIQAVDHEALNATRFGIMDGLRQHDLIPGRNIEFQWESAQGNPALASQIAQKFVGNKYDVIVAIGTTPAQAALQAAQGSNIPIVYASVTDPKGAKLQGNITGVSNFIDPETQLKAFKQMLPPLKKIGVIKSSGEQNSEALVEPTKQAAQKLGMEVVFVNAPKSSDVYTAAISLKDKVDALFVNNDNTALSAFDSVVKAAKEMKIPAFVSDTDLVSKGALAALGPNQHRIGVMAGEMVVTLLGQDAKQRDASKIDPLQAPQPHLHLNLTVAQELELTISDTVIREALKVY